MLHVGKRYTTLTYYNIRTVSKNTIVICFNRPCLLSKNQNDSRVSGICIESYSGILSNVIEMMFR